MIVCEIFTYVGNDNLFREGNEKRLLLGHYNMPLQVLSLDQLTGELQEHFHSSLV
jgi:hypothetical protein